MSDMKIWKDSIEISKKELELLFTSGLDDVIKFVDDSCDERNGEFADKIMEEMEKFYDKFTSALHLHDNEEVDDDKL